MKIDDKKNIMHFDSDDEFYQFCVVPEIVIVDYINPAGKNDHYMTFNLSPSYLDAVDNGTRFMIHDPKSQIYKHQAVSYRTCTKPIQNLIECYDI